MKRTEWYEEDCPDCDGKGFFQVNNGEGDFEYLDCVRCETTGYVKVNQRTMNEVPSSFIEDENESSEMFDDQE